MRAMQHIGNYEERGLPFSAWLYRIARNMVANWHRDEGRRKMIPLDDVGQWRHSDDSPELSVELREKRDTLLRAIRQLPMERQELLYFKFVDRLSNAEIGATMKRSEGAVKSLYHRTLLALRDELSRIEQRADGERAGRNGRAAVQSQ
jgi:RNA polymerase sigma-70 factor (ECF subfamily)